MSHQPRVLSLLRIERMSGGWLFILVWILLGFNLTTGSALANDSIPGMGIHSWAGWQPGQIAVADCPELRGVPLILKWHELEPSEGGYQFDRYLGDPLRVAQADGLHVTVMIWVGPAAPAWLYAAGVPEVRTDRTVNALGEPTKHNRFPYYFSPVYQDRFFRLIDALAAYVHQLSPELQRQIVFIQSAEGSTGDGQPYKGTPREAQYVITPADWNGFRQATWMRFREGFPDTPILVNSDANEEAQTVWLLENMDVIALKQGMFSHGFHVSNNRERLARFRDIAERVEALDKRVLTRGEMDRELFVMGWSRRNVPQALYWSGLFATHCELDIWNVPSDALRDPRNGPALTFFNAYAGQRDAARAPRAFSALREGLDAADFDRFPAEKFGGIPGQKNAPGRYRRIADAYAFYGARLDDPSKAMGGGMLNRKRSGSNDVGWGILPSNYERFLTQLDPGSGDVAWWNIDDSIYGRFGRGFEHETGKTTLRFKLDDAFFGPDVPAQTAGLRVVYLDRGWGSWTVNYAGSQGAVHTVAVQNQNSGEWVSLPLNLPDASWRGTLDGADVTVKYADGDNTIFHLIEVERRP